MNIRTLTAIGVITVAGAAAGCSDQTEYEDTATTMEPEQQQMEPTTTPSGADRDRTAMSPQQQSPMGEPTTDPQLGETEQRMGSQTEEMATGPEASEFASFDTNSDGKLGEDEWEANAEGNVSNMRNMTFAQIDRNASGDIDLQEFRKAKTTEGSSTDMGADTEGADPTAP